jgi:hypothetical protein
MNDTMHGALARARHDNFIHDAERARMQRQARRSRRDASTSRGRRSPAAATMLRGLAWTFARPLARRAS